MQPIYRFFLCISLLSLFSCEKEPVKQVLNPERYWGEAMANRNGICWVAEPYAVVSNAIPDRVDVFLSVFDEAGFLRQNLGLIRIPTTPGTYTVYNPSPFTQSDSLASYFQFLIADGDVVADSYETLESVSGNHITITSYETASWEISGTFELTLLIDQTDPKVDPTSPDTLQFHQGTFTTKIAQ